jgi:hypothetical protein
MRQPTRRAALAAMTCAIAMSGCGEETEAPTAHGTPRPMSREERSASQRLRQFLAAMEAKEDARACRMMTPDLRRAITSALENRALPGTCRTRAAHIFSPAKAPGNADATVKTLTVTGSRASATVAAKPTSAAASPGLVESDVQLEKRDGRWLIANF